MKNSLISVIIPIYNVEKYLEKCIESIINQTYTNLEIILINDGSTDNCDKICEEYAKKDNRIKVIHKLNEGLSNARNTGLDVANGKLIVFVDSDDYIKKTMIEELKNNMEKYNSDISTCNYYRKYKIGKIKINKIKIGNKFTKKEKFIEAKDGNKLVAVCAWNKLYKKEIFEKIRFPEGKIYEDSYTIYDIVDKANKISYNPKPLYFYRMRKSGIVRGNNNYYDQLDSLNKNIILLSKKKYYDLVDKEKYRKTNVLIKIAISNKLKTIKNDNNIYEEIIKITNELKDSKYLNSKQKNKIKKISNNINKYYIKKKAKIRTLSFFKSFLYYK